MLEAGKELESTREENARLAKELEQLKRLYKQLLRGTQKAEAEAEATSMAERCTTLEAEVSGLQDALDSQTAVCAGQREAMGALRQELRDTQNRVESQDERCTQLERELRQGQRDAELERYRAVAAETRKWESREARLVRTVGGAGG